MGSRIVQIENNIFVLIFQLKLYPIFQIKRYSRFIPYAWKYVFEYNQTH